jgi:hypothetical protein
MFYFQENALKERRPAVRVIDGMQMPVKEPVAAGFPHGRRCQAHPAVYTAQNFPAKRVSITQPFPGHVANRLIFARIGVGMDYAEGYIETTPAPGKTSVAMPEAAAGKRWLAGLISVPTSMRLPAAVYGANH